MTCCSSSNVITKIEAPAACTTIIQKCTGESSTTRRAYFRCTASLCTVLVVALIFSLFLAEVLRRRAAPVWGRARSRTTTLYVLESFETVGLEIHGKLATQARSRIAHPMSRNCFGRTHSSPKHAEGPYLTIGFLLTFIFSVSHQWTEIRAVRALDRDPNDGRDSAH